MFVEQLRRAVEASPRVELARMAQPLLPFPRPALRRSRGVRAPFTPSLSAGPYRLPHDVRDRLAAALMPFRNRDAAFALATFLGRFWSTPARLLTAFPIDRRELSSSSVVGQRMAVSLGVERSNRLVDGAVEVIRAGERLMSEVMPLQVAPETLDIVQLRSIFRQPLDGEPVGARGARGAACLAGVDRAVVE